MIHSTANNSSIEQLVEYPLTRSDLAHLSDDQFAALGVLSYAVSEHLALRRIYLSASHPMIGKKAIDSAIAIHMMLILRTASSKLFEVAEFLKSLAGRKPETQDPTLQRLAEAALEQFKELEAGDGFKIARDVRNEAANHYSFKAAKKNIKHLAENANLDLYLHNKNGNSFYPMGEELMFIARISRNGAQFTTKEEKEQLFTEWFDWNIAAGKWLEASHFALVKEFILDKHPKKLARKTAYWIPPNLVGDLDDAKVPIFFRIETRKK